MRVELNLCSNVLRMPVPVAVCQAERNVDEERREERGGEEGDRDRAGKRTGREFYLPAFHLVAKYHFLSLLNVERHQSYLIGTAAAFFSPSSSRNPGRRETASITQHQKQSGSKTTLSRVESSRMDDVNFVPQRHTRRPCESEETMREIAVWKPASRNPRKTNQSLKYAPFCIIHVYPLVFTAEICVMN